MSDSFYFYINFPTFASKKILIHRGTCGHCNHGNGKKGGGSNEKGFWAGPFNSHSNARRALDSLIGKFQNPPLTGDCSCI
jgi:hypothetical protein